MSSPAAELELELEDLVEVLERVADAELRLELPRARRPGKWLLRKHLAELDGDVS